MPLNKPKTKYAKMSASGYVTVDPETCILQLNIIYDVYISWKYENVFNLSTY